MESDSVVYIVNEQPPTCSFCEARSDISSEVLNSANFKQYHRCLNLKCQYEFVIEQDLEMYEEWSKPLDKR